jgi:hypothetical protein
MFSELRVGRHDVYGLCKLVKWNAFVRCRRRNAITLSRGEVIISVKYYSWEGRS